MGKVVDNCFRKIKKLFDITSNGYTHPLHRRKKGCSKFQHGVGVQNDVTANYDENSKLKRKIVVSNYS